MCLLLAAVFGLVNSNAKFQVQSDKVLDDLGFKMATFSPHLFLLMRENQLLVMIAKIVKNLLQIGAEADTEPVFAAINGRFQLGTIVKTPGVIRYHRLNISQIDDMSIEIDGDDKLDALECLLLT